ILDGNGAAVNVTAAALAMQAQTGIGTGADGALETAVSNVEALTATGGIFLSNNAALTVGGVTPDASCITVALTGVDTTISGNIEISAPALNVNLAGEDITAAGAGNITLSADDMNITQA